MTSFDFQTVTHGKWILAGEHAVIRGKGALVFPIPEKTLTLHYKESESPLEIIALESRDNLIVKLAWAVLERAMQLLGKSLTDLQGHFYLINKIPVGAGMGSSAACCTALSRWLSHYNMLSNASIYSFAKELEHLFHGKSSGLDVVGVSADTGILFQKGQIRPLQQRWKPHWYISFSGQLSNTSSCITQVQELWDRDPTTAASIDQMMEESLMQAFSALESTCPTTLPKLACAIRQAGGCFKQWGLVSEPLQKHMNDLLTAGALAVKPTGSGWGGHVISLWENPLADTTHFIPLN